MIVVQSWMASTSWVSHDMPLWNPCCLEVMIGVIGGHPPPRDCTNSSPHHQTADRMSVYPGEPGLGYTGYGLVLADLGLTCCAGDCPRTTAVSVVLNKRQTTSPVDVAPSTDHLRGSMASLFGTMRREHGSRTMLWTYEWCVMAHARRRRSYDVLFVYLNGSKFVIPRYVQIFYRVWLLATLVYNFLGENVCLFWKLGILLHFSMKLVVGLVYKIVWKDVYTLVQFHLPFLAVNGRGVCRGHLLFRHSPSPRNSLHHRATLYTTAPLSTPARHSLHYRATPYTTAPPSTRPRHSLHYRATLYTTVPLSTPPCHSTRPRHSLHHRAPLYTTVPLSTPPRYFLHHRAPHSDLLPRAHYQVTKLLLPSASREGQLSQPLLG